MPYVGKGKKSTLKLMETIRALVSKTLIDAGVDEKDAFVKAQAITEALILSGFVRAN